LTASHHTGQGFDRATHFVMVTDRNIRVGFVQRDTPAPGIVVPIAQTVCQAAVLHTEAWNWALAVGDGMLKPEHGYQFPAQEQHSNRRSTHWYEGDEQFFATSLIAIWVWNPERDVPALCAHIAPEQRAKAVQDWRTYVVPAAAQIIHGLYLAHCIPHTPYWPDPLYKRVYGRLARAVASYAWRNHTESTPPPCTKHTIAWLGAAAKLAHGWLAFYAHTDAPRDREHHANRLKLQRLAALAFARRVTQDGAGQWVCRSDSKPATWYAETTMLLDALECWQAICIDDANAWLFERHWWVSEERGNVPAQRRQREVRREDEMWQLTNVLCGLLDVPFGWSETDQLAPATIDFRSRLLTLLDAAARQWYRPRYDLTRAGQIERTVGVQRALLDHQLRAGDNQGRLRQQLARMRIFCLRLLIWLSWVSGLSRLYVGILVGYLATGLAKDTWELMLRIVSVEQGVLHFQWMPISVLAILAAACTVAAFLFFAHTIHARRIAHPWRRTRGTVLWRTLCCAHRHPAGVYDRAAAVGRRADHGVARCMPSPRNPGGCAGRLDLRAVRPVHRGVYPTLLR